MPSQPYVWLMAVRTRLDNVEDMAVDRECRLTVDVRAAAVSEVSKEYLEAGGLKAAARKAAMEKVLAYTRGDSSAPSF